MSDIVLSHIHYVALYISTHMCVYIYIDGNFYACSADRNLFTLSVTVQGLHHQTDTHQLLGPREPTLQASYLFPSGQSRGLFRV